MKIKNKPLPKKEQPSIVIPCSVLQDRTLSVLEAIVEYLKDVRGLTYHGISLIINRDERNVWTVYYRAKIKRKNEKKK